jgi:hypothetical protein
MKVLFYDFIRLTVYINYYLRSLGILKDKWFIGDKYLLRRGLSVHLDCFPFRRM